MAETPSNMLPLGTKAPNFELTNTVSGRKVSLGELKSNIATVVMFICNHCPYVKIIKNRLSEVANDYTAKGISFIAISSNNADKYPSDGPEAMKQDAKEHGYTFPYLYDETQDIARAYQAACTPDFYVFDRQLECVYRGRFDEATPGNGKPVTGNDLVTALDCILNQTPIAQEQVPSLGCNIKWR